MRISGIFAVIAFAFVCAVVGDLPPTVHKCAYGDSNCISETMQYVMNNYAKTGIKEMNLIPFEPLHVKTLKLDRNPQSPVNIELVFKDVDVIGLSDAKVAHISGFTENLSELRVVELKAPKVILKGPYSINGNVLILPIVGKGNSVIVLENVHFIFKAKTKPGIKDGKKYLVFENMKLEIKPQHVTYDLENLFNGNKELGDNMNKFINENWSEIFSELQPAVSEAFALILKHVMTSVFSKQPYEDFFEH